MNHAELIARLRTDSIFDNSTLGNEAADALERRTAELATAIANVSKFATLHEAAATLCEKIALERDALEAEKAEREKQEPAYWIGPSGNIYSGRLFAVQNGEQMVTPLYRAPGAE